MMNHWRTLIIALISLPLSQPAQALFLEIEPILTVNAAAPLQQLNGTTLSWTSKTGISGGVLLSAGFEEAHLTLETGVIQLKESSERITPSSILTRENTRLQIPLVLRYQFDDRFGIGVGAYTSFSNGSVLTTTSSQSTSLESHVSAGIQERDMGLLICARASIPIVSDLRFVIDGRYQHGLSNLAMIPPGAAGDYHNTRSMQAFLGLSWMIQI
jgi:hypothetical protein